MPHTTTRDPETGRFEKRYRCDSCEMLSIQGFPCHETGCPEAWKDQTVTCKWCGAEFEPEARGQRFCSDDCGFSYDY